jgi:hypothetical protein
MRIESYHSLRTNMSSFLQHEYIAYRFMPPGRLLSAADVSINYETYLWSRIFLMWRGISAEELESFQSQGAGYEEGLRFNWKDHVGWSKGLNDKSQFRVSPGLCKFYTETDIVCKVIEISILEV